jgi:hypothetical protein
VVELAEVVRRFQPRLLARLTFRLRPAQEAALAAIASCRTAARGGHVYQCTDPGCGRQHFAYHSCRNRACPRCHGERTARLLERWLLRLLPCPHLLLTFTLPAELRRLASSHPRAVYAAMLEAAAATTLAFAADPQWLGGLPGMLAVLHTWTRELLYHPHVHLLLSAGALAPDGGSWIVPSRPLFFAPQRALAVVFRQQLRAGLCAAGILAQVPWAVWRRRFIVHVQPAGSGRQVVAYLARYVFRSPLARRALVALDDTTVTFRVRSSKSGELHSRTIPGEALLARLLLHVLPRRFVRVRQYGLYARAPRHALALQALARSSAPTATLAPPREPPREDVPEPITPAAPAPAPARTPPRCPHCGAPLALLAILPPRRGPP